MNGASSERGQPVQIGVLLIFAFLIIGLAFFQAVLVPQENAQVEFNHNQNLQDDMVDLRSDLLRSAATGEARTTRVRLGTTYPTRTLLLNPAPPGGTLRSTHHGNLSIANARATSSTGVEDFWDGDPTDDPAWTGAGESRHTFRTNVLLYGPSYNAYDGAPETVLGGSVLYNRFPEETVPLSNQTFVSGRTITLTAVQGEYDESTNGAVTVDPRVVSPINRTVTVTDTGDPVTLRVPTRLSEETWRDLLSGEMGDASDQHVESVSVEDGPAGPNDVLVVTLEPGVSYNLKLGAVAVGSRGPTEGAEHDPEYLVVAGGSGNSIDEGDTQRLTLEVRDRYNNPVSGAEVTVQQPTVGYLVGSGGDPVTLTTNTNGRATVTYAAPRNVRTNQRATVPASIPGSGDERAVDLTVDVEDDSESVSNDDYRRPLLSAVEPSPDPTSPGPDASAEFVRVYVPERAPGGTYYVENAGGTRSAELTDPTAGEYYFTDSSFTGPCQGAANVNDLNFGLDTDGTLRLVYDDGGGTTVRDQLDYEEGDTFDADGLGERIEEDGAYVDSNVSTVDWRTATASEACGSGPTETPSAEQVAYVSGSGGSGPGPSTGGTQQSMGPEETIDNTILTFDVENTGSSSVEVTGFTVYRDSDGALTSGGSDGDGFDRLDRDAMGGNEFVVGISGAADADDATPPGRNTFPITDPYASQELDTSAVVSGGTTATVELGEIVDDTGFVYDDDGWTVQKVDRTSPDRDLVVSLEFADGSTKRVYLSTE